MAKSRQLRPVRQINRFSIDLTPEQQHQRNRQQDSANYSEHDFSGRRHWP